MPQQQSCAAFFAAATFRRAVDSELAVLDQNNLDATIYFEPSAEEVAALASTLRAVNPTAPLGGAPNSGAAHVLGQTRRTPMLVGTACVIVLVGTVGYFARAST